MARSVRHTPIVPCTNIETEKKEKRVAHQRERKWVHDHLIIQNATAEDFELEMFHNHPRAGREMFGKDGKQFVGSRARYEDSSLLRK